MTTKELLLALPMLAMVLFVGGQMMLNRSVRQTRATRATRPSREGVLSFTAGTAMFGVGAGLNTSWMVLSATPSPLVTASILIQLMVISVVVYANVRIRQMYRGDQ